MIWGTFITITSTDTAQMVGYVESFLGDLTPLLLPIVAVGVGIFIFWAITKALK